MTVGPAPSRSTESRTVFFNARWRLLVILTAFALSLLAVELVLRTGENSGKHWMRDPVRGWALTPGYRGWYEEENRVWVAINTAGLRDREHDLIATPHVVRVAVLGDSFMEAANVPFEKSFVPMLEQALDACLPPGRKAEAFNFGVSGYGTYQQLLTYRQQVRRYRPDIVLLMAFMGNDLLDNSKELDVQLDGPRPYLVLSGNGTVVELAPAATERYPIHQRWRIAVTTRSKVALWLWQEWSALRESMRNEAATPAQSPRELEFEELDRYVLSPPQNPAMRSAWHVTETLFDFLAKETAADGAEFWMSTVPTAEQVHPDLENRRQYAARMRVPSLSYADDRVQSFAESRGIPFISIAGPLAANAASTGSFLHGGYNAEFPPGTGHWNETAHHFAALTVAEQLCGRSRAVPGR